MWNDSTTFVFFILDILGEYQFSHSVVSDFMTPRTACQASLSITNSWSLLKLMPSSQWCHQPSHPLSTPSPPAFYLSQHQGLFQWVSSSHQVAKVLELQLQNPSMNIQGWFPLGLTDLISLLSKGLSRAFSKTTVQKHQFFDAQVSLWSNSHIYTWLLEKPSLWLDRPLSAT